MNSTIKISFNIPTQTVQPTHSDEIELGHIYRFVDLFEAIPNTKLTVTRWNYDAVLRNPNFYLNDFLESSYSNSKQHSSFYSRNPNVRIDFALKNPKLIDIEQILDDPDTHDEEVVKDMITHPELSWDWRKLSRSSQLDINIVVKHQRLNWDWDDLTQKQDIKVIERNPDLPWIYNGRYNSYYGGINHNETVTVKFIRENPEIKWNFEHLSRHMNVKGIRKDLLTEKPLPWDHRSICRNKTLTSKFLLENPDLIKWNFEELSKNRHLDFDQLIGLSDRWDWYDLIHNPSVTTKFVYAYFEKFEAYIFRFIRSGKVKIQDIITKYPHFVTTPNLVNHPDLTADIILSLPKLKDWSKVKLSRHPKLTVSDYRKLLAANITLDFKTLSENPNISYDFIYDTQEKPWDYQRLSYNKFNHEKKVRIAYRIQHRYKVNCRKKKMKLLNNYLISDLSKIVYRYMI